MGIVPPAPPPVPAPGLLVSATDLISSALRLIQSLAVGESLTANEINDGLLILNEMIDSWQAQRLMIYAQQRQLFTLTSGQQAYKMGTGAPDFDVPRPARIDYMGIITTQNQQQPLEIPLAMLTQDQWLGIPVKNIGDALCQRVWDDNGFPWRTLNFWPFPNIANLQVSIYNWQALSYFPDSVTKFSFPPGYLECLRYNLAVRLANEFPGQLTQTVLGQAAQSMAVVKSQNILPIPLRCDEALVRSRSSYYNYKDDNANIRN